MSQASKTRTVILTASTAALAVTGAWYGAGLKTKQEIKKIQKVKARGEVTPAQKIAYLEQTRSGLMAKKTGLEEKIAQLEARSSRKEGIKGIEVIQGK
ncbi:hypothetical protein MMC28_006381 [Mycoblastus sanguinarius]|nr:hypothetical protein [Mycoblastus sanguinarius]